MEDKKNILSSLNLNRTIWLLTASDIFTWGIYLPLLSLIGLYLSKQLNTDSVEIVGIGVGIYYVVRSLTQIPIGIFVDKIKRDRDDLMVMILGNILMGVPFLLFPIIQNQNTFFVLQVLLGLGASMNLVTWRKLFAKNLDHHKEGTSYAVYDTVLSAAIALISLLMGLVANIDKSYFDFVMIFSGLLIISSTIWPLLIFFVKDRNSEQ